MMHCNCHSLYAFKMAIQLLAQLQTMLSHLIESHPAIICSCYQDLKGLHGINAADIRLSL